MGNRLCCDTGTIKEAVLVSEQQGLQRLKDFMTANPDMHKVCPNAGNKYGSINKQEILEYNIGCYMGKIVDKKRNGLGLMMFHDNMYYEGQWHDDRIEGNGIFIMSDGDFYEGEWKQGKPHGHGIYVSKKEGWSYEGDWVNGEQHGHGKQVFEDKSYYQGEFKKGLRNGKGIFRNHDQRVYEGYFVNGEVHGHAKACDFLYFYEGEWKNGKLDGIGRSEWYEREDQHNKLQIQYIGEYKNGRKNGFGEYRDKKEGAIVKGMWKDGSVSKNSVIISKNVDSTGPQTPMDKSWQVNPFLALAKIS